MLAVSVTQAHVPRDVGSALTDALCTERRLLDDLTGVLESQRAAVERDDLAGVDESIFAAQRVFRTLGEARRYRRSLLALVTGRDDIPLGELDAALGPRMTLRLRAVRDELREAARRLEGQIGRNRLLLQEALSAGDQLIRAFSSAPATPAVYAPPGCATPPSGTILLDRQA